MNVPQFIMFLALFNVGIFIGCQLTAFGEVGNLQLASDNPYIINVSGNSYNTQNFTSGTFPNFLSTILSTSVLFVASGVVLSVFAGIPILVSVGYALFIGFFVGLWTSSMQTIIRIGELFSYIPLVPSIFVAILSFCTFIMIIFTIMQLATGGWRLLR